MEEEEEGEKPKEEEEKKPKKKELGSFEGEIFVCTPEQAIKIG